MNAIIVTIGDEILLGQILDTNSKYIADRLSLMGVEVQEMCTVSDQRDEIYEAVDYAMNEAELVVVTGGLGPTKDDVTKKVLAEYFGSTMSLHEDALEWLEELLKGRGVPMNESNRSQAILPDNCRILRNYRGTASGMWFEKGWKSLISLPGVPFEMEELLDKQVIPELVKRHPHLLLKYKMLKVYGIPESALSEQLAKWEGAKPEGIGLAYLPSPGYVRLRVTARGKAVDKIDGCYDTLKAELEGLHYVEGDEDTVEKQLGVALKSRGVTVATAESCTGGHIAHMITSVPGSSAYFKGGVVAYTNEVKNQVLGVNAEDLNHVGAVSETVVRQMAEGARRVLNADYAVATTGVAGPDGGTDQNPVGTVWIGVAGPNGTTAQRCAFSFSRERNIAKAAVKALEMVMEAL